MHGESTSKYSGMECSIAQPRRLRFDENLDPDVENIIQRAMYDQPAIVCDLGQLCKVLHETHLGGNSECIVHEMI